MKLMFLPDPQPGRYRDMIAAYTSQRNGACTVR